MTQYAWYVTTRFLRTRHDTTRHDTTRQNVLLWHSYARIYASRSPTDEEMSVSFGLKEIIFCLYVPVAAYRCLVVGTAA